ncbi:MAG: tetratricopeptide repeat protein [Sebaldella sp.]|nr:tetratricopeptide repeat protein [Sebaldella sp.]
MRYSVLGLIFILTTMGFSKTDEDFLHEFNVSDKSIVYYNEAVQSENMNAEIKETKELYKKAVSEDKENYLALNKLGYIYRMENNLDDAQKLYLKSIEVNPDGYEAYDLLIELYQTNKEFNKVKEYSEILINKHPDYPEGYYNLAEIYEETDQNDLIIKYYSLALERYNKYDKEKFPDKENVVIENAKLDCIVGIANSYSKKSEFRKSLEKLLLIDPISSNYSDIQRQNYTNIVMDNLEKLYKINSKSANNYLRIFKNRNILPQNFNFK